MEARGQTGGFSKEIGRYLAAALIVLILGAAALALALLLPRWLAEAAPSSSQLFILFLIGALTGYLAELILRGSRPLGYAGSVLAAMIGAWVGSNVLPRPPAWDWAISTSRGNVAVITSLSLALLASLIWRAWTGWDPLSQRLVRVGSRLRGWSRQAAQSSLNDGTLVGFTTGATTAWGVGLGYILRQQNGTLEFLPILLILTLTGAFLYSVLRLLRAAGFRLFGQQAGKWWGRAILGYVLGLTILFGLTLLLYPVSPF